MNTAIIHAEVLGGELEARPRASAVVRRDIIWGSAFLGLLLALLPVQSQLIFAPGAVRAGEWWRVLTHPFVHVSWYHALLDGVACVLLWRNLERPRWSYVAGAGAGSVLAALWFWPAIGQTGLCGLSGVAHGLMGISALEMIRRGDRWGGPSLLLLAGKAGWEAATGQVCLAWLHFGMMGTPVAVSHLGGVLGGLAVWCAFRGASGCKLPALVAGREGKHG